MKRRIITDRVQLLNKEARALIRTFTNAFGNPKIVKFNRREKNIPRYRYILSWYLSNKNKKFSSTPPCIRITVFNNIIYNPNKKNPKSLRIFKKKSEVMYSGYNGKKYETYYQIMNQQ